MKTYIYEVEVIDENSGTYMDFEYEHEVWDDDDAPVDDSDMYLSECILSNISIVPRLLRIEESD